MNDLLTMLWAGNLDKNQLGELISAPSGLNWALLCICSQVGRSARDQLVLGGLKVQMWTEAVCLGASDACHTGSLRLPHRAAISWYLHI